MLGGTNSKTDQTKERITEYEDRIERGNRKKNEET
jgi:hypothetical protein